MKKLQRRAGLMAMMAGVFLAPGAAQRVTLGASEAQDVRDAAIPEEIAEALPDADRELDHRIDDALKAGVDDLVAERKKQRGAWENETQSAFLVYALLELGHGVDDPRLRADSPELAPAAERLLAERPDTALNASFKALALSQMQRTPELKIEAAKTRDVLLSFLRSDGSVSSRAGANTLNTAESFWAYRALAALQDIGVPIDAAVWKTGDDWWRSNQLKDGGWPDIRVLPNSHAAATAAGVGALYLAASHMGFVAPPGKEPGPDGPLELGVKKLLADFNARGNDYFFLNLWEQAACAGGIPQVEGVDWYRAGATQIVSAQRSGGSWLGAGANHLPGDADGYATAFAMLFLARGRAPVMFDKLEYGGSGGHWNDRPRDAANLTRWLGRELDRPLNWRVASLGSSPVPWGNAPILLITGAGDPNFNPEELAKLRAFVYGGGMIFSVADAGDTAFTNAIVKKYAPLLAENRYEMRPLPQNHELFGGDLYAKLSPPPEIVGLSNGVREWWVHAPADMSASWQGRRLTMRNHFLFPANLVRYATGNGLLGDKLQGLAKPPTTPVETVRTIRLARLEYAGNFDPEPGAWPRLASLAPPTFHSLLEIVTVKIADLDASKTPVAHLTGTASFTLTAPEIAALKKFLDAGGTLLADSAGASPKFTASFRALMAQLYPAIKPAELAVNDPVFNGSLADSARLSNVSYRKYAILKMKEQQIKPHIEAITVNGRHVILFSPEDMTSGLLGTETWGIRGYEPESAMLLARNLLLYASSK